MRKIFLFIMLALSAGIMKAQTDVTNKYIQNPDFGARFAGWTNSGSFSYSVAKNYTGKSGEVFLEKWVASGGRLGTNQGIWQTLRHLPEGTYTMVVSAQNIQQSATSTKQTGAFIFADNKQVEVNAAGDYSLVFTVPENTTVNIGIKLQNCTGNWVAVDNFRLYQKAANADSLQAETQRINDEIATLKKNIENATGPVPTVVTQPYMALGPTIILGRSKITTNGATIKERGLCWTTDPEKEPTIFDDKTYAYFNETGMIFRMEGLTPATMYYVRAYAITNGNQVAYGDVVQAPTMPKSTVNYGFDYAATSDANFTKDQADAVNFRINSGMAETVWMYNNLSWINGLYLNVHYVRGAGAGDGTADCSYGGWMRVSQKEAYQQTGTMLHETNHGVGVGTTGEWYNNSNLRSNTSSGKWLGPRATQMIRFLENNDAAYMQGDGTHMWAGTTSGTLVYGYGINGAQEDRYQPSNQQLYFGNILITHAMHQDGLISTGGRGITPSYSLTIRDKQKYYLKCEDASCGGAVAFLGAPITNVSRGTRALRYAEISAEEAMADDNFAWYITFIPSSCLYVFQNVGTGRYLYKEASNFNLSISNKSPMRLLLAREQTTLGSFKGSSYWMSSNGSTLTGGTTRNVPTDMLPYWNFTATDYNPSNAATAQRWFILTADEVRKYDSGMISESMKKLDDMIAKVKAVKATPHQSKDEGTAVESIDEALESVISSIEEAKSTYTNAKQIDEATANLLNALLTFLEAANPSSLENPFDISMFLVNPELKANSDGWTASTPPAYGNNVCEYFQKTFDLYQTTTSKLPAGFFRTTLQVFNRPGSYTDVYTQWKAGTDNSAAILYAGSKTLKVKNMYADAQSKSMGTGSVAAATGVYIPNTMQAAESFFKAGLYVNTLDVEQKQSATLKVGLKLTSSGTSYWTCFTNLKLYYLGTLNPTGIEDIHSEQDGQTPSECYDLTGRRISTPKQGLYISGGKKILVK